ncbi:uncharacterized protein LOC120473159 isoform X2 [Pimephales promelas]|uniref:uncharacterized protein LOC120473159 isoform X2 n=1 Tax=Pimephales promelas TaxID=90988 RepID=UPI001955E268|nr:uncharacterized protein LOC120473159 isoform X2 [Pimephales promelas]
MPSKVCYFHPAVRSSVFGLPTDPVVRQQWLHFMFDYVPENYNRNLALCAAHFTKDSFQNLYKFNAGFNKKLLLNPGAVPTLKPEAAVVGPQPSTSLQGPSTQEFLNISTRVEVGCQTDPMKSESLATEISPNMRSATQLSTGTLRDCHARSGGIQATVSTLNIGTEKTVMLQDMHPSSTPIKGSMFRPRKRPRLELEEDEEMDDTESQVQVEPQDSTYNPESTATKESELSIDPQTNSGEKKYIVFESSLRELFGSCPICKTKCTDQSRQMGTFVAFSQQCEKCQYNRQWQSQPIVGSTPVGNLLLSAATYFTGGSFVQLQKIFKAMNLQMTTYSTFRKHARNFIEPTIIHKWNRDQLHIIAQLQQQGKVPLAGDMRADTPGHSAKFGSYTLMHVETNKILDLQLIQSNEVGGSHHMEKEGLTRCLDKLESNGLAVDYLITDRQPQIQKYLRERSITQFYDVWHFQKGLSKKLDKLSQNKDCKVLKTWLRSIKNHIYWSATSTVSGPERLAKWTSLLNHIQNVHVHENPLYPKCEHPDRVSRDRKKWFQSGSVELHKLGKVLYNKRVLKDIEKLSHHFQTSSLKAFRSLILRFAPKNVVLPFIGMLCRLYLAAMHYNENSDHQQATTTAGKAVFIKGECTAKPVKIDPTYNRLLQCGPTDHVADKLMMDWTGSGSRAEQEWRSVT